MYEQLAKEAGLSFNEWIVRVMAGVTGQAQLHGPGLVPQPVPEPEPRLLLPAQAHLPNSPLKEVGSGRAAGAPEQQLRFEDVPLERPQVA